MIKQNFMRNPSNLYPVHVFQVEIHLRISTTYLHFRGMYLDSYCYLSEKALVVSPNVICLNAHSN